jgi:hypothetical protein
MASTSLQPDCTSRPLNLLGAVLQSTGRLPEAEADVDRNARSGYRQTREAETAYGEAADVLQRLGTDFPARGRDRVPGRTDPLAFPKR